MYNQPDLFSKKYLGKNMLFSLLCVKKKKKMLKVMLLGKGGTFALRKSAVNSQ